MRYEHLINRTYLVVYINVLVLIIIPFLSISLLLSSLPVFSCLLFAIHLCVSL